MDGPVSVDLDEDGPHLLVAGTTGSGKSATLETLLLSLAHSWGPHDLTLALMDFKGGAGLGALAALPHVRSLLTDLDGGLAERALVALAAELDERKRALASAGFESFSAWERATGAPPRLVVVADEYQEISAAYRDFVPHIARLAAQGRSLGLHLVLSTQRPAGAVTPDIRANISTVIALRVTSEAESRDVIGTPEAARIPAAAPGRAILARGTHHVTVQVAQPVANPTPPVLRAGACDSPSPLVEAVQARWAEASPAPALWAPPLPDEFRMEPRSSPADACVVALADVPEQRRTEQVLWQPRRGPLVAVGPSGSGRTALLAALTEQCSQQGWSPVALPPDARLAERTLELAAGIDKVMIIADDVTAGDPRAPLLAGTLPFAAVIAGDATLPLRSAAQAAVTIIMAGLRDALAWGVPREYAAVSGPPGRSMVVAGSRWRIAQAARGDEVKAEALVQPLPQHISRERADCWPANVIGLGGDRCDQVVLEPCRVAVIGPAGSERDAAIAWLESRGHACSAAEHGAGIKGAAPDAFLVLHPTRAGIRSLAPAVPEGLIDTAPHPGRVALIQGRSATPLQLPQGAVQPPQLPDLRPPRAPRDPATAAHRSAQR
jgi:S-DNA-T family DNA segregation ATPase FtsK/SpoIIIE